MRYKVLIFLIFNAFSLIHAEEIGEIIKNSDMYKSSIINSNISKSRLSIAILKKLPLKLNLSTKTYGSITDPTFNYSIGADFNYTILDPDATLEIKQKEQDLLISSLLTVSVYEDINYQISQLVVNYIARKNLYDHVNRTYTSILDYTRKISSRFESRDLSISEKLYADSILLKNRASLIDAEYSVDNAIKSIELLIGFELPVDFIDGIMEQLVTPSTTYTIERDVKREILELQLNKSTIERDNTKGSSSLLLSISNSLKFPFDSSTSWQLGVNATIPLFGRNIDLNNREEISYEIENRSIELDARKNDLNNQLQYYIDHFNQVTNKLEIYKEAKLLSSKSLEGVLKESKAGVTTVFDVISANNSLSDIDRMIIESENEILSIKLNYTYLIGGLIEN